MLALEQAVAALELVDVDAGDGAAPVARLMRAWIARCDSPVRRATAATSAGVRRAAARALVARTPARRLRRGRGR